VIDIFKHPSSVAAYRFLNGMGDVVATG